LSDCGRHIENNYGWIILTIFKEGEILACYGALGALSFSRGLHLALLV
jgi:hypothetical protein